MDGDLEMAGRSGAWVPEERCPQYGVPAVAS